MTIMIGSILSLTSAQTKEHLESAHWDLEVGRLHGQWDLSFEGGPGPLDVVHEAWAQATLMVCERSLCGGWWQLEQSEVLGKDCRCQHVPFR